MKNTNLTFTQSLLLAAMVAGTFDIIGAIVILAKGNAAGTLKYIASGLLGNEAFTGGTSVMLLGLLIHYMIALFFSSLYFIIYRRSVFLRSNRYITPFIYGLFIWATMKFLVLPMTHIPPPGAFQLEKVITEILILTVAFGCTLPFFAPKPIIPR